MKESSLSIDGSTDPHTFVQRVISGGPALTDEQLEALSLLCALAKKALHGRAYWQRMNDDTRKEMRIAVDEARNAN